MTLDKFYAARLDEDEAIAQAALEQWHVVYEFNGLPGGGPVRVLRTGFLIERVTGADGSERIRLKRNRALTR
jgi:hypothetical protein